MTEAMKYMILSDVDGLDMVDLELNTMNPTDSYNVCWKKLDNIISHFDEDSNKAWVYFLDIYKEIPVPFRRILMMEEIYHRSEVDYPDMLNCIKQYVTEDETAELKEQRISDIKKTMGFAIDADGKVLVYRGISEGRVMPDFSVCWTLRKDVAEAYIDERLYGFGKVVEAKFDVEDILYYTDGNGEYEVFVIPRCVKEGWDVFDEDDGVEYHDEHSVKRLDESRLEKLATVYDPYDE